MVINHLEKIKKKKRGKVTFMIIKRGRKGEKEMIVWRKLLRGIKIFNTHNMMTPVLGDTGLGLH